MKYQFGAAEGLWVWWRHQWPSTPTHLCVASVAAGALIMAGLLCVTSLGLQAPITLIGLFGGLLMGLVAAAIEANCTDKMLVRPHSDIHSG